MKLHKITYDAFATWEELPFQRILAMLDSQEEWFDYKNVTCTTNVSKEIFTTRKSQPSSMSINIPYKKTKITLLLNLNDDRTKCGVSNDDRTKCGVSVEAPIIFPYRKKKYRNPYGSTPKFFYAKHYERIIEKISLAYKTALPVAEEVNKEAETKERVELKKKNKWKEITTKLGIEKNCSEGYNYSSGYHQVLKYNGENHNHLMATFQTNEEETDYEVNLKGKYTVEEIKKLIEFVNYSQHNVLEKLQGIGI